MNIAQKAIHAFVATLSMTLSFGILSHDSHVETVYATALSASPSSAYVEADQQIPQNPLPEMRGTQHAHAESNPSRGMLTNSFTYQSPSIAPRRDSHHKELLRTLEIGGRHAFDNANLPIIT